MKKIIFAIIILLSSATLLRAQSDSLAIAEFIQELEALDGDYVEKEHSDSKTMLNDIKKQAQEQFGDEYDSAIFSGLGDIWNQGYFQHSYTGDNRMGRNLLENIIEKYNVTYSDELFGIPLVSATREDLEEQYLFSDSDNTLIFHITDDEVEIVYTNYNLLDLLKNLLVVLMTSIDETDIDIEGILDNDISLSLSIDDLSWKQVVGGGGQASTNKPALSNRESIISDLRKSNVDAVAKENEIQRMNTVLDTLEFPSFVENKVTGRHYVAIPQIPAEWEDECEPYAINNIYDWINETNFGDGCNSAHQQSVIITPRDVALQYAVTCLSGTDNTFTGYPQELKKNYFAEYQGGTPAVLYRKALTPKGYTAMKSDLAHIFNTTQLGGTYKNMKVIQRSLRGGYSLIQLYGDAGVLVTIIDNYDKSQMLMSITIGANAFANAVNACAVGGKQNIADKCSILINENGISFTQSADTPAKNGVIIEFDLFNKFINQNK